MLKYFGLALHIKPACLVCYCSPKIYSIKMPLYNLMTSFSCNVLLVVWKCFKLKRSKKWIYIYKKDTLIMKTGKTVT